MLIHTVKDGDTIFKIAESYGTPPSKIIEYNDLKNPDRIPIGLELLIVTPTKSYTAKRGETADDIAKKFGVEKKSLKRANLNFSMNGKASEKEVLAIKQDTPRHGTILLNGQLYRGYDPKRLSVALEYAKYITLSSYKAISGGIAKVFDDRNALTQIRSARCAPIMRIYDQDILSTLKNNREKFTRAAITTALAHGYRGITLTVGDCGNYDEVCESLIEIKKDLMNDGLMLFIESENYSSAHDIADAAVVRYEKCHKENIPTFILGEKKHFTEYAKKGDSIKAFMDISPFAFAGGEYITKKDAVELAYRAKTNIKYDDDRKICHFEYRIGRNSQNCCFESLKNIKAKLQIMSELGFMGMSFDITRCPTEHLIMCLCEFSLPDYSSFEI